MATFNSLPAECLGLVLALASECDTSCPVSHLVALRTLAVSSLVAQGWREPAQARMWRSLYIWRVGTAAHIAASPICGKFRTARVELGAGALGVNETLGETLGKLVGVESIEIDGEDGWEDEEEHRLFDDAWVNLPSLSSKWLLSRKIPEPQLISSALQT